MLTVFQCVTMEGWTPILYWVNSLLWREYSFTFLWKFRQTTLLATSSTGLSSFHWSSSVRSSCLTWSLVFSVGELLTMKLCYTRWMPIMFCYFVHLCREFAKEKERVESRAGFMALKEQQKLEKELTGYVEWICRAGEGDSAIVWGRTKNNLRE